MNNKNCIIDIHAIRIDIHNKQIQKIQEGEIGKMLKNIFIRNVDEEVWNNFKAFIAKKYGKLHGIEGLALTEALRQYLRAENEFSKNTHTKIKNVCIFNKKIEKEIPVLKQAILSCIEPGGKAPKTFLANIIRKTSHVMDKRSINSRIEALVSIGFLKIDWETSLKGDVFIVLGEKKEKIKRK